MDSNPQNSILIGMKLVRSCAVVCSSIDGIVTLRVPSTRCDTCPGFCIRFNRRNEIKVKGDLPVGANVNLVVSASGLSLATVVTFGLPLLGLIVPLLFLQNAIIAIFGLLAGVGIAMMVFRLDWMSKRLEPRVERL